MTRPEVGLPHPDRLWGHFHQVVVLNVLLPFIPEIFAASYEMIENVALIHIDKPGAILLIISGF